MSDTPRVDALPESPYCDSCHSDGEIAAKNLARQLEREHAELAADARRYRWLREHTGAGTHFVTKNLRFTLPLARIHEQPYEQKVNLLKGSVAEHLDTAIDAAIDRAASREGE